MIYMVTVRNETGVTGDRYINELWHYLTISDLIFIPIIPAALPAAVFTLLAACDDRKKAVAILTVTLRCASVPRFT